jgi:AraC-like DNA-binding protein
MDFLQVSGLGFGTLQYGAEMSVEVTGLTDYHVILFCLSGGGEIRTPNAELRINERFGFACNAGQSFRATFSIDCEQFIFRIDRKALQAHTGESELCLQPEVDLGRPAITPWVRLLQALLAERATLDLARSNPRVAAEYEQLLLSLFLVGQPHTSAAKDRTGSIAPGTVRKAEEFIYKHLAKPITLEDIANAAGVPSRTLLESFRRFRNVSPIRHLRDVRLDKARTLLLTRGAERRVAEIAAECGFAHLSRFAQDYQARFGENPSKSAARAKQVKRLQA